MTQGNREEEHAVKVTNEGKTEEKRVVEEADGGKEDNLSTKNSMNAISSLMETEEEEMLLMAHIETKDTLEKKNVNLCVGVVIQVVSDVYYIPELKNDLS
ncbi:hypothetical protein L195_g019900 [Trifolium pratense]|uniref:Uncharacterized protein n=1 Tax=Trifolium pratense TaxID=57577 RepID=A0A2K3N0W5_TRIPR|nr:hypothetical protein L195_g019900 [Trifolium pratense]